MLESYHKYFQSVHLGAYLACVAFRKRYNIRLNQSLSGAFHSSNISSVATLIKSIGLHSINIHRSMSQLEFLTTFDNTGIHADPGALHELNRVKSCHQISIPFYRSYLGTDCCECESFPVPTKPPTISTSKLTRVCIPIYRLATDCSWQYFDTGKVYRLFVCIIVMK